MAGDPKGGRLACSSSSISGAASASSLSAMRTAEVVRLSTACGQGRGAHHCEEPGWRG